PQQITEGVPEWLGELCMALLERDPARRPAADEILKQLGQGSGPQITLRPMDSKRFVGREEELRHLRNAWSNVEGVSVVLLSGPSGIGKTALAQQFLRQLSNDEGEKPIILSTRCYPQEWIPFRALDGIVDALCVYLKRLPAADVRMLMPHHAG